MGIAHDAGHRRGRRRQRPADDGRRPGLSIAYHPKPAVREQAMISIMSGGMDRALEVLKP